MRTCFVILTCQKYEHTRVVWQKCTSLASVDPHDIVYLGHCSDVERRLFSWGAGDDYHSLPYKFVDFFRYFVPTREYDWYVFLDDDTYLFVDRLLDHLQGCDPTEKRVEGHLLTHIAHTIWGIYPSGGAGTVLSVAVVEAIRQRFRTTTEEIRTEHWCADICLGQWVKAIHGTKMFHHPGFHPEQYREGADNYATAITFHHLKTEADFIRFTLPPFKIDER